tara:strand:+ start:587 stop:859 length:273 start_codon:yes stop_codon:yes gene_type:complete
MIRKTKADFKISDKLSLCCNAKMKLDTPSSDVGVCTKCGKLAIDKTREGRLWQNRNQSFKKIADDAYYNVTWNRTLNNYTKIGRPSTNTK